MNDQVNKHEIVNISFSVDGEWLTDFIRDRFLYEGMGIDWAVDMIGELLNGNGLTEQHIERITQDIILERSRFEGNTLDGSFVYCECSDEPLKSDFFRKYSALGDDLKRIEQAREEAVEAWQELALVINGELDRRDCKCQCNIDLFKPTPVEEFIDRMIAPEEEVAPYGFISPDGEFHPVPWLDHEEFAENLIRSRGGWDLVLSDPIYDTAKDVLVMRLGWLLLHNPSQGKPILSHGSKPMTKAQREALFDYYTKYGMKKEANELFEEDDR